MRGALLLAALVVSTRAGYGQTADAPADLYSGAMLRLWLDPRHPIVGTLSAIDTGRIILVVGLRGSAVTVPLSNITGVERGLGRPVWRDARTGALLGLAAGALVYAKNRAAARRADRDGPFLFETSAHHDALVVESLLLPPLGAALGRILSSERWQRVDVGAGRTPFDSAAARVTLVDGDVIRTNVKGRAIRGMVIAQSPDSVTLSLAHGMVTLSRAEIRALAISGGPDRSLGIARGTGVGALAGFVLALGGKGRSTVQISETVLGAGIGAVLGWQIAPTKWTHVARVEWAR